MLPRLEPIAFNVNGKSLASGYIERWLWNPAMRKNEGEGAILGMVRLAIGRAMASGQGRLTGIPEEEQSTTLVSKTPAWLAHGIGNVVRKGEVESVIRRMM